MFSYQCHPAIESLLVNDKDLLARNHNSLNVHFVTTYLPSQCNTPHGGLSLAANFRLENPNTYLIILSFLKIGVIQKSDHYGILNLKGTFFLRLPFEKKESLLKLLNSIEYPLVIPQVEWESFVTLTCKALLEEKISQFKHGSQMALGNKLIYPLRASCLAFTHNPKYYMPLIKEHLKRISQFIAEEQLNQIFRWATMIPNGDDIFLKNVIAFQTSLNDISEQNNLKHISIPHLLQKIDKFIFTLNSLFAV